MSCNFFTVNFTATVCFTDLDQGSEISKQFSLLKSIKHTVDENLPYPQNRKNNIIY